MKSSLPDPIKKEGTSPCLHPSTLKKALPKFPPSGSVPAKLSVAKQAASAFSMAKGGEVLLKGGAIAILLKAKGITEIMEWGRPPLAPGKP
jgi:hypothetical protein